ncbi:MAG: NADPH:quinone reductase [Rhizobiaceae bacterium]|nr:NADPH:quinone reductase [Rhizobiaceae bacterium]MCV0406100.1 NADPH:quinone reductase [Rhizobiaceae bacterium]
MKAVWYEKNGAAVEVLTVGDMPVPEPAPGEVRVRLHASGVNPSDVKSRRGRPMVGPRVIPHSDGAGIIEAVGEGIDQKRIGERVWVWNGQWKRPFGTAAEYIALPAAQAVGLPEGVDFAAAACFGIPLLTAIHAVTLAEAGPGRTILVTGAASAVGHYAAQIATMAGARVIGTASSARAAHAKAAGAEIVDYKADDVAARVLDMTGGKGVDAIIDMDLSTTADLIPRGVLVSHGTYVCYGSNVSGPVTISFPDFLFRCVDLRFFVVYELTAEERAAALQEAERLIAGGKLLHTVAARYPLDQAVAAHEAVEEGKVIGNVVLEM